MKLRQVFEARPRVAIVAFGRMNPPTIGHKKLVDKITSMRGDHFLFLSQTQNPKDNPLPFDEKKAFAQQFFPKVKVGDPSVRTIIDMMKKLEQLGYTKIVYVAGDDRVGSFTKLLTSYNQKEYNFDSVEIVSAGTRDPDADGAAGMSASKMRLAAASGNLAAFNAGTPSNDTSAAEALYKAVRIGMKIKDSAADNGSQELSTSMS